MMERFFLSLKTERIWQRDYVNSAEAMSDIADYIVAFYNSLRLHSNWATCHPMPSSSNRQSINLSRCPKKLDQHMRWISPMKAGGLNGRLTANSYLRCDRAHSLSLVNTGNSS